MQEVFPRGIEHAHSVHYVHTRRVYPPEAQARMKFHFSAITAAISFFRHLTSDMRVHIRRVVILEDHKSVAYPECKPQTAELATNQTLTPLGHAEGLVPFCVENKKLRIERRVELCGSVFAPDRYEAFHAVDEEGPRPKDPNNYKYRLRTWCHHIASESLLSLLQPGCRVMPRKS
jgi:hypothetical protein